MNTDSGNQNKNLLAVVQSFLWTLSVLAIGLLIMQSSTGLQTLHVFAVEFLNVNFEFSLRFDVLSTLLFLMVTLLGASIAHYANRYLDGEARQSYFFKYLSIVVISTSFLVLSNNLILFFIAWTATSFALHKLLTFYPERPMALAAARKKWVVSRLGDVSILIAIVMVYKMFGTFEFTKIFESASILANDSANRAGLSGIGFLLVLGAVTKSAQFPFHFWLPETMETPTPVSALMHAGVINAGGFLVIRMSPLLEQSPAAHIVLTFVGAYSAVFGGLCMIVQNDIKKKLAYSTISQMGMMMFACGLGAYGIALLHIFAHSFYKAHAFLSTGSLVEESKKVGYKLVPLSIARLSLAGIVGLTVIACGVVYNQGSHLATFTYVSILLLGLFQNYGEMQNAKYRFWPAFARITAALLVGLGMYSFFESLLHFQIESVTPIENTITDRFGLLPSIVLAASAFFIFYSSLWITRGLMQIKSDRMRRLYTYFKNGGYFGIRSSMLLAHFFPIFSKQ